MPRVATWFFERDYIKGLATARIHSIPPDSSILLLDFSSSKTPHIIPSDVDDALQGLL